MTTKTCTKCQEELPISAFNKRGTGTGGYNANCRKCINSYRSQRRLDIKSEGRTPRNDIYNKENRDKLNARRTERRREIRDYIRELKRGKPCEICGGIFPPTCMDFDHLDPTEKDFNICGDSTRELLSEDKILAEIAKCRLICANCHRVHSAMQRGENPEEWEVKSMQTFKWSDPVPEGYKWCLMCKKHYPYENYHPLAKELEQQGYHVACNDCSTIVED